jgi:hypothetical protein
VRVVDKRTLQIPAKGDKLVFMPNLLVNPHAGLIFLVPAPAICGWWQRHSWTTIHLVCARDDRRCW